MSYGESGKDAIFLLVKSNQHRRLNTNMSNSASEPQEDKDEGKITRRRMLQQARPTLINIHLEKELHNGSQVESQRSHNDYEHRIA